jgi:MEKHLA domain
LSWHLNPSDLNFFDLLVGSFERLVGKKLVERHQGPEWLYGHAPFAIVAHNTDPDPAFVYANVLAQRRFGYSWKEFINLRTRLTAELSEEHRDVQDRVTRIGYHPDYRGLGVTKCGSRFRMEDGLVWQLRDPAGRNLGQAAVFSKWVDV